MASLSVSVVVGLLIGSTLGVNNGLARTPQMGWNNWNSLGCDVSDSLLLDTSTKLVSSGLRDVGYTYIVLDDCWSEGRRGSDQWLLADRKKFPRGMKAVADDIHALGLLFGMYSSAGEMTCARFAGSLDFETQDAQAFASWGVDYLKYDNCYHMGRFGTPQISYNRYDVMWKALNATGRPILYSLCSWGEDYVHTWGMSLANSWRMSGDIYDAFTRPDALCSCDDAKDPHCIAPGTHCSVLSIMNRVSAFSDRAQPGGWNDLDMLEVGNGGMTDDEYKAHFSMWAALKSPLLMGHDLRTMSAKTLTILNNPAIIAISQDTLGLAANLARRDTNVKKDKYGMGETHLWTGQLAGGDQVVVLFNAADEDIQMSASLEEIFYYKGPEGSAPQVNQAWDVYDLWAGRMDIEMAQKILDADDDLPSVEQLLKEAHWYNSSALSYKEGLRTGDSRLLGRKTSSIAAGGTLSVLVKRHSAEVFRLRNPGEKTARYSTAKDEL
ncbi:glycoside hydrolase family 27 protein [Stipitochalara longipes BDJ]|nr:glycoside hydrolase family 27 protein [Stipitochalara longipes BDJ]